jgi:hypothetical protein
MRRRISLIAVVSGVIAQLTGLALDALLHARDDTLAAREGVLTLSNPGHLLFALGLALTVLGAATMLTPMAVTTGRRGAGVVIAALPAVAVLTLAGGAFTVAVASGGLTSHPHPAHTHETHVHQEEQATGQGAATPVPHTHAQPAAAASTTTAVDGSRHEHGVEVNVSWEQLREIDQMLTRAKAATEKYRDVNLARAEGYIQVTHVVPGLGAHFVHPGLLAAGVFDVERPAILLYDRAPGEEFELVGVSWSLPKKPGDETPPPAYFGALGTWHYHTNLCFGARGGSPRVSVNTAAGCRAAGGAFVRETGWMVHAWIFRPSPEG